MRKEEEVGVSMFCSDATSYTGLVIVVGKCVCVFVVNGKSMMGKPDVLNLCEAV